MNCRNYLIFNREYQCRCYLLAPVFIRGGAESETGRRTLCSATQGRRHHAQEIACGRPDERRRVRAGSGRRGGDGGGGVERVDRGLANEEAEDLAERITGYVDPLPCGFGVAVLLVGERCSAAGFFGHQLGDGATGGAACAGGLLARGGEAGGRGPVLGRGGLFRGGGWEQALPRV